MKLLEAGLIVDITALLVLLLISVSMNEMLTDSARNAIAMEAVGLWIIGSALSIAWARELLKPLNPTKSAETSASNH